MSLSSSGFSSQPSALPDYCVVIEPNRSWFRLPWRELLHYRDLWLLLVRRDFVAKYKQTILGPAWFIIQPLLMTVMFTIVFTGIAEIPTDGLPPGLFYLCGMLAWTYFGECIRSTSTVFVTNASLFGKVYFPRLVVPLAIVTSNLIAFVIQLLTFTGFWLYFKFFTEAGQLFSLTSAVTLLPLLLLQTACIGLGVGLWMSCMTAKYRDFVHLTGFLTQLWMYATPIVYPLSEVPEKWRWISALNPMTGIVETYRYALLGAGTVNLKYLTFSAGMTLVLLVTGILLFSRTERTFIDTV